MADSGKDLKGNGGNLVWQHSAVTMHDREVLNRHSGAIVWLTGLPCSGKSTLAYALEEKLHRQKCRTFVLDGDNIRHGLCSNLGFSDGDRTENIRRVGEVSKLFYDAGTIVIAAFVSPFRKDREMVRSLVSSGNFFEVFCDSSVDICEARDVKGMYRKAKSGEIKEFTGVSSPYEPPINPDLALDTTVKGVEESIDEVVAFLKAKSILPQ